MFPAPIARLSRATLRRIATSPRRFTSQKVAPSFPTVQTCPSPTCPCADTPSLPDGLEIDRKSPLNGVISTYHEHVLVCTGQSDWPSRIEEANAGDNLAADLKELFGRGGVFSDPFHHISILNASFPPSPSPRPDLQTTSAYLLPSFTYVPLLPRVSFDSVQALAQGFLLPEKLHAAHAGLSPVHRDRLTRQPRRRALLRGVRAVREVLVLVCGHGGRDARCGVLGPVVKGAFEAVLPGMGVGVVEGPVEVEGEGGEGVAGLGERGGREGISARVGLISHIGGHKFAGNVIIYIPPGMKTAEEEPHPLAGCGVWYGRVEPRHVEGIVRETILKGNVIADMFRGGITPSRDMVRL